MLPKELQQRLINELDKRLDVDLDELLSSPKLRVKLSPAKLDKLLLELYDGVVQGPSGDVFRVIGGGANVGRQNLYMQQQQSKLAKIVDTTAMSEDDASTPTSLVKRALKRNLLEEKGSHRRSVNGMNANNNEQRRREVPKMSLLPRHVLSDRSWGARLVHRGSFTLSKPRPNKYSPLI